MVRKRAQGAKKGLLESGDTSCPRINLVGPYLKKRFGHKMAKLALDGGFTCPNRDGTCGYGGCSFCSERGSGDQASDIESQIALLAPKWKDCGYLAYFQSFTNTYASVPVLREKYEAALADPRIEGLAIATRPDCLPEKVIAYLAELHERVPLWVELGLQTIHEETARGFGRGYELPVYDDAVRRLREAGIDVVTHLILGLPGESREAMVSSVRYVTAGDIQGLKLHLLNVVAGSRLAEEVPDYAPPFADADDYAAFVCDLLEIIPAHIVMHRLSADSPKELLIAPKWAYRKRLVLNKISAEMTRRGSFQGCRSL